MNVGIPHEEAIAPELTLPVQFRDIWHGARAASPEMILAVSVLGQAANDLQSFRFARRRRQQQLYREAYDWVASSDRSWPYAFPNLCDALRLSTESARAQLLGDARLSRRLGSAARPGATAMVFRLGRPANVKPMKIARPARGRGRPPRRVLVFVIQQFSA
jgi:hypothetical protein